MTEERTIELPEEDEQETREPEAKKPEDYKYSLLKHQTYRSELILRSVIQAVIDLVFVAIAGGTSLLTIMTGKMISAISGSVTLVLVMLYLCVSIYSMERICQTLYDYHVNGEDTSYEHNHNLVGLIIIVGSMLVTLLLYSLKL